MNTLYNCNICDKALTGKQRQFCSVKCKNAYYQGYETLKKRAKNKKIHLLKDFGGTCNNCGYSKSIEALSFYDNQYQSLHLNTNIMANLNFEGLKQNLFKHQAQLLCNNCVAELRNPTGEIAKKHLNSQEFVKNFNENLSILLPQKKELLILAVSGGVDSITMLTLFAENYPKKKLIVAHVNHKFRADSDIDEKFVKNLASKYGIKFISKSLEAHKQGNLEDYFREERHKFLKNTARKYQADYIVLAHNADDQAETVLMNLVRGSGPSGLSGMKLADNLIIRPLLTFPKSEIIHFAKINKLEWHEDSTNQDLKYTRNYIRHRVLPLLERINPKYLDNIARSANIQQEIEKYIKEAAQTNRLSLKKVPEPVRYEIFASLYEKVRGSRKDLTTKHLEELDKLLSDSTGTKSLDLPGEITAIRTYNQLEFVLKMKDNKPLVNTIDNLSIGSNYFGNYQIKIAHFNGEKSDKKNTVYLDDIANFIIRAPHTGDRIKKRGLNGHKKLQDLFVDAKIDRVKRKSYPILVAKASDEIIWVPNLAISENINNNKIKYSITISEAIDEKNEKK